MSHSDPLICTLCGMPSDQSFGSGGKFLRGHVVCGNCQRVLERELLTLEDDEPAGKAYDRARMFCEERAKRKSVERRLVLVEAENDRLRREVETLKGILNPKAVE